MRAPEYKTWDHFGTPRTQVTPQWKRELLLDYAYRYQLKTFVETGTCDGETVAFLEPYMDRLYTVEKDPKLYETAINRFCDHPKITFLEGDSGEVIKDILPVVSKVLFWLDAHDADCVGPIVQELNAIYDSGVKGIVLIDDMDYIPDVLPLRQPWHLSEGIMRIELTDVESKA